MQQCIHPSLSLVHSGNLALQKYKDPPAPASLVLKLQVWLCRTTADKVHGLKIESGNYVYIKGKKVQENLKFKRHGIKWGMKTQFFYLFIRSFTLHLDCTSYSHLSSQFYTYIFLPTLPSSLSEEKGRPLLGYHLILGWTHNLTVRKLKTFGPLRCLSW